MPIIVGDYIENSIGHYLGRERFEGHLTKIIKPVYCLHVTTLS